MERPNFLSWFTKLFLRHVELLLSDGPVILFVDGHHSHIDLELIYTARKHNVHLMCLPPNLTYIMQPLDVSVFRPLKQAYSKILKEYKTATLAGNISKAVFPSLLNQLWDVSFKPSHLCSGFQATGIHPLQREVISNEKLNAGVAFRKPPTQDQLLSTTPSSTAHAVTPPPLILKGNCRRCGFAFTPMRAHITLHFTKVLQARKHKYILST